MTEPLRQIVYASTAATPNDEARIAAILAISRRNNARDGVTGLLYADEARFMQAIEGTRDVIEAVFARIRDDDRHRDVTVLLDREIAAREFGRWSMADARAQDDRAALDQHMRVALNTAAPTVRERFRDLLTAPA